jgi:hypothetical protein
MMYLSYNTIQHSCVGSDPVVLIALQQENEGKRDSATKLLHRDSVQLFQVSYRDSLKSGDFSEVIEVPK